MVHAIFPGKMRHWLEHPTRTAIAAVVSLVVASAIRLPEAYWAPITTLIVTQSTLGAAWTVSCRRLAGTALGAASGAVLMKLWGGNAFAFGVGILVIGLVCPALRLEKTAYRYAGITLAIVMLIPRANSVWTVAIHRFIEVSIGIAVGLVIAAVWPEGETGQAGAAT